METSEEKTKMISKFIDNFLLADFEVPFDYSIADNISMYGNPDRKWIIVNITFDVDVDRYIFEDGTTYIKQLFKTDTIPDTLMKYLGLSHNEVIVNISYDYVNDGKLNRDLDSLKQNVIHTLIKEYQITFQDIQEADINFWVYQSREDNPYIKIECQIMDTEPLVKDNKIELSDFEDLVYEKSRNYQSIRILTTGDEIQFWYD
jgi:hypothetical protein